MDQFCALLFSHTYYWFSGHVRYRNYLRLYRQQPLLKLPRKILVLCRWTLGGENHHYAIASLDKPDIDPVVVDGLNRRRRGKREDPWVSTNQSDSA